MYECSRAEHSYRLLVRVQNVLTDTLAKGSAHEVCRDQYEFSSGIYNLPLRQVKFGMLRDCHDGNVFTLVHTKATNAVIKRECYRLVELVVVQMVSFKQSLEAPLRTCTFITSFL